MDTDVLFHTSLSEEKLGKLERTHTLGLHVICGTRFLDVSEIFPVKRLSFSKTSLIKFWPFTRIKPGVLSLVTLSTDMVVNQTPYTTTIETELLDKT